MRSNREAKETTRRLIKAGIAVGILGGGAATTNIDAFAAETETQQENKIVVIENEEIRKFNETIEEIEGGYSEADAKAQETAGEQTEALVSELGIDRSAFEDADSIVVDTATKEKVDSLNVLASESGSVSTSAVKAQSEAASEAYKNALETLGVTDEVSAAERIGQLDSQIETTGNELASKNSEITQAQSDLENANTQKSGLQTRSGELTQAIETAVSDQTDATVRANQAAEDIADATGRATQAADDIEDANGRATQAADDIADATGRATQAADDIADATGRATQAADDIEDANGRATQAADDIEDANGRATQAADDIADATERATQAADDIEDANERATQAADDIEDANERASQAAEDLETANAELSAAQTDLTNAQAAVKNIAANEVVNNNYLTSYKNATKERGKYAWYEDISSYNDNVEVAKAITAFSVYQDAAEKNIDLSTYVFKKIDNHNYRISYKYNDSTELIVKTLDFHTYDNAGNKLGDFGNDQTGYIVMYDKATGSEYYNEKSFLSDYNALVDKINKINGDLAAQRKAANDDLKKANEDIASANGKISDANGRATQAASDLADANGRATQAASDLADANGRATQAASDLADANGRATQAAIDLANANERATQAASDLADANGRATQAAQDLAAAEGRESSARSELENAGSQINTLTTKIETLTQKLNGTTDENGNVVEKGLIREAAELKANLDNLQAQKNTINQLTATWDQYEANSETRSEAASTSVSTSAEALAKIHVASETATNNASAEDDDTSASEKEEEAVTEEEGGSVLGANRSLATPAEEEGSVLGAERGRGKSPKTGDAANVLGAAATMGSSLIGASAVLGLRRRNK